MISVPADIAGQSKHAADWLDGRKEQGPSPAATSHLPPAISASHTAKPPHPPGKVVAQKTADQQLLAQAAHRVQRQAEQAKKKEDEAKKKKKEEEEKRKKQEKGEEEKRKKKGREEEERRKKKEKEEEEKRRKKAEEEKADKVMRRALSLSLHVLCMSLRVLCSVLRVLCRCYTFVLLFPGKQDGTAAGTPAAARIKASTEAACPSPRPATRTTRSVRFHPTQYGSQGQAAEQSRRRQGGKRWAHAAPRLVPPKRLQASVDHLLHHCDRADDCGGSRSQASRRQGPSGPRGCHHPQRSANKGRRRRKRTTGGSSCPAARCSPPKAKRMRSLTNGSRGGRRTRPMRLRTSAPTQRP